MRKKEFVYDERSLEVQAKLIDRTWTVRVFENGESANFADYRVDILTTHDASLDIVGGLMENAKRDFVSWSKWKKREAAKKDKQPPN